MPLRRDKEICVIHIAQQYSESLSAQFLTTSKWNQVPRDRLITGHFFRVASHEIEFIVRLIASGYPLISGGPSGRTFSFVYGDEIYDADDQVRINHSVFLIGPGVLNYPSNPTSTNSHSLATWPLNPYGEREYALVILVVFCFSLLYYLYCMQILLFLYCCIHALPVQ
jgi:hypothetical protein